VAKKTKSMQRSQGGEQQMECASLKNERENGASCPNLHEKKSGNSRREGKVVLSLPRILNS
jgi:hypothetical protein